jgi:hypothetical protein
MFGKREKYLALAVVAVLVAYVADRLILTPALAAWRRDGERVIELRQEVAQAESLAEAVPGWRKERARRQALAFALERSEAENEVLKSLASSAVARRLSLKSIRPSWREAGSVTKGSPAQLELSVSATGTLASVAGFLYDMETRAMPVRVSRSRLQSRAENGRTLDVDLTLSVLAGDSLKEDAE